ncbi:hypothetical protein Bbelb_062120 [Branchiostoma belcheri]|nr:hypothetical protein Bbelb_062120 [Branchiostoma belcheri]
MASRVALTAASRPCSTEELPEATRHQAPECKDVQEHFCTSARQDDRDPSNLPKACYRQGSVSSWRGSKAFCEKIGSCVLTWDPQLIPPFNGNFGPLNQYFLRVAGQQRSAPPPTVNLTELRARGSPYKNIMLIAQILIFTANEFQARGSPH